MKILTYFEDAEADDMPHMLIPVNWQEVKSFFEKEVKKLHNTVQRKGGI